MEKLWRRVWGLGLREAEPTQGKRQGPGIDLVGWFGSAMASWSPDINQSTSSWYRHMAEVASWSLDFGLFFFFPFTFCITYSLCIYVTCMHLFKKPFYIKLHAFDTMGLIVPNFRTKKILC